MAGKVSKKGKMNAARRRVEAKAEKGKKGNKNVFGNKKQTGKY